MQLAAADANLKTNGSTSGGNDAVVNRAVARRSRTRALTVARFALKSHPKCRYLYALNPLSFKTACFTII